MSLSNEIKLKKKQKWIFNNMIGFTLKIPHFLTENKMAAVSMATVGYNCITGPDFSLWFQV
jgi:hypothetical protein